jgi:hypothetical protein
LVAIGASISMVSEEVAVWRDRRRAKSRAIEAEWRIHQIKGDARDQMWDEVTRHRGDGG